MKHKTTFRNRIQGWIPKETSTSNQTIGIFNFQNHLTLLRLAYGTLLGTLLIIPFGVYHSTREPYIQGYLWGYNLPIGYIGLLLGILLFLFPKTVLSKRSSLGVATVIIGLVLIGSVYLIPREPFINWINGTNFSGSQIDVDFAIGNAITLFIGLCSIMAGLVSEIGVHSSKGIKNF